jgi:tetratricopeptide (TPR) repeat protein
VIGIFSLILRLNPFRQPVFLFLKLFTALPASKTRYVFFAALAVGMIALPAFAQKDRRRRPSENISVATRLREAETLFTDGEKYFVLEDYTKALGYFQRSAELNPENATVHYKIAEIFSKGSKQEDLVKAAASIENALSLEKKNKYFYILASTIYSGLNNFNQAEHALETMMSEVKGTDEYLYELAALYQYDHKADEAIRIYDKAENLLGINEVSSLQKQRLYLEKGRVADALKEGEKLIDAFPDEERFVLGFAEILAQYKQGAKAVAYLEAYTNAHPDDANAKILLVKIYSSEGALQKSKELLNAIFDDASVSVGSKVMLLGAQVAALAQVREKNNSDPDSEAFVVVLFSKLRVSNPAESGVHEVGGDLFLLLKKYAEAEQEYRRAVELKSVSFEVWQNLVNLEAQQNEFDSLIVHTDEGLELFPNQAILYYFRGYAQLRKKHYREAVTSLELAKKMSVSNSVLASDIDGMLGDSYNSLQEYEKSDKAYEDALVINPDNDLVLNNYCYYLALRKENLEKAEKLSTRLVKNHPDNSTYLDTYSWVLYMREKYKEARKVIEKAISTGNANATLFEHYGDILFRLGKTDDAVQQWEKSKSLDNRNALIDKKIANRKLY